MSCVPLCCSDQKTGADRRQQGKTTRSATRTSVDNASDIAAGERYLLCHWPLSVLILSVIRSFDALQCCNTIDSRQSLVALALCRYCLLFVTHSFIASMHH